MRTWTRGLPAGRCLRRSHHSVTAGLLLCLLSAAGCEHPGGASDATISAGVGTSSQFPLRVENCGLVEEFLSPPKRAVTLNQQATEMLLALSLEDRIVGSAWLDDEIQPRYRAQYDAIPVLSERYPSLEVLLAARPDFVYGGFASAFAQEEGRSRDDLHRRGIPTYLAAESCAGGPVTIDTVYDDLRNLGAIFGAPERAESTIAEMRTSIAETQAKLPPGERLHVLKRGAVVASGAPEEVLTPERIRDVYGVRAEVEVHPATGRLHIVFLPAKEGS